MRTAGVLQMDTPLPDGRLFIPPTSIFGGGTVAQTIPGMLQLNVTGAVISLVTEPVMLLRYGMSDDAQQQYGKGAPSGGYQGAQGQPVTPASPFTSPYGPNGRPPMTGGLAAGVFSIANPRPKGLKPMAVTVAYSVTGGPMTAFQLFTSKTALNVGVTPAPVNGIFTQNLPLQTATTQLVTTQIPAANQAWLSDPFDIFTISFSVNAGAANLALYGVYLDCLFNYN